MAVVTYISYDADPSKGLLIEAQQPLRVLDFISAHCAPLLTCCFAKLQPKQKVRETFYLSLFSQTIDGAFSNESWISNNLIYLLRLTQMYKKNKHRHILYQY